MIALSALAYLFTGVVTLAIAKWRMKRDTGGTVREIWRWFYIFLWPVAWVAWAAKTVFEVVFR